MSKTIGFIVLTCDSYSDLWLMYINFFDKYWPDCPFDKYIVTNHKSISNTSFEFINIGKDDSWSDGLLKAIAKLKNKHEYIFVTLEDRPIIEKVDQLKLNSILHTFFQVDGNFLSLFTQDNMGKPTSKFNNFFGLIDKGSLYRPTCVYSLWKISVLEDLLDRQENAWEFERFGSVRSDKYDGFYMTYNNFFKMSNTVIKGKWQRSEYNLILNLGYTPDLSAREIFTIKEELFHKFYSFLFKVFIYYLPIPYKLRRKIVFNLKGYKEKKTIHEN
jgi:hypothetical protein